MKVHTAIPLEMSNGNLFPILIRTNPNVKATDVIRSVRLPFLTRLRLLMRGFDVYEGETYKGMEEIILHKGEWLLEFQCSRPLGAYEVKWNTIPFHELTDLSLIVTLSPS